MQNIAMCMRAWGEVRNYASQKFRLTPDLLFLHQIWLFLIELAGKICICRAADFLATLAIFRRKNWSTFVHDL